MKNETDKIEQIPIDSIDDPDIPIRTRADENSVFDLADSIRDVGIIQPIIVRPKSDRFEVVAGHRRLIAARVAGLLTVPCIVNDTDDVGCDVLRLHENLAREDVNIIDQARFLKRLSEKYELSVADLSGTLRRSGTWVRDRIGLLDWPKDVFEALNNQKLSYGAAKWLAKISEDSERRRLLNAAIGSGVSSRVAYDWYSRWKAGTMPKTEPPPTEIEPASGERIEYFTSRCRICGEPIIMGDEEVLYVHRKCIEAVEQGLGSPAVKQEGAQ